MAAIADIDQIIKRLNEPELQNRIRLAVRTATLTQLKNEGIEISPEVWGELNAKLLMARDPGDVLAGAAAVAIGISISDERVKENIDFKETTASGIRVYEFSYKGFPTRWMGVMAQEIRHSHPNAVYEDENGLLMVDYSKLDVKMSAV